MPKLSSAGPLLNEHLALKNEAERARLFSQLTRKEIAGQIRMLREKRQLTQVEFAKRCRMKQSAISRIEQAEYAGWTYKTLARIAEKLHARLRITYEPIEEFAAQLGAEDDREFDLDAIQPRKGLRRVPVKTRSNLRSRSKTRVQA